MKKRYSEEQIIKAIKQHEAGTKVEISVVIWAYHKAYFITGVANILVWK